MRILKYVVLLSGIAFFLNSCDSESPNQINLSGTITSDEGPLILSYVDAQKRSPIPLDTMELTDGKFSFSWSSDSVNFYTINTSKNYYIPLLIESGESVQLDISGQDVDRKYTVDGSPGSKRILDINEVSLYALERVDSLDQIANQFRDSANYGQVKQALDITFQKILDQASNGMKKFIDDDPGNLTNLLIFSQKIGRQELVSPINDFDYYEKVAEAFKTKYPNNQHTNFFAKAMEQNRVQAEEMKIKREAQSKLVPGAEVPEISLPSPDGDFKNLSDLKGKIVLVDFWAAWCGPCRAENPNLLRMYNEYKSKGFEVFSVSLDGLAQQPDPKSDWTTAIEKDGLIWENHVSDVLGRNSTVARRFGLMNIPYTILVDREGKIIQTNLRGPALEAKLKEVLGS